MLDLDAKRTINNARDILVGKVPNPQSQVDLITIAMIYKFMDDMDLANLGAGGNRTFFIGELEPFAFSKIMDSKLGAQDRMNLYVEALEKLPFAKSVPDLFRAIFKGAFLPFRDPATLNLFLREINNFSYDNSENLGNAFEYLLSIMGSQGDAGQFRTPRHIIDFIVDVVKPTKMDSILDPACGTAGFLISAYLHIKEHGGHISVKEMQDLTGNIVGYDISPDMRKLALVNLYLHKFAEPRIYEYDTLTSDDRWNDKFDVILANPPFMTPKGGIVPHNKFSVNANRAEVLFVDYIAEHLNINGRAGIIVPEGIIFQGASAYKALRKMLIDDHYLYAVVSLPSGVFKPYSGVKTSILLLDRQIAKQKRDILFVKIENDGFDLGAQRKPIAANDLPKALEIIERYKSGGDVSAELNVLVVPKSQIAEGGEYKLDMKIYQTNNLFADCKYEIVKLGDVAEVISGQSPEGQFYNQTGEGLPFYQGRTEFGAMYLGEPKTWTSHTTKIARKNDILMSVRAPVGPVNVCGFDEICIGRGLAAIRVNDKAVWQYVYILLKSMEDQITGNGGAVFDSINRKQIEEIKIPLPPIEVQRQIVAEIENKQSAINEARKIMKNLERERFYLASLLDGIDYELVELGDIIATITPPKKLQTSEFLSAGAYPIIDQSQNYIAGYSDDGAAVITTPTPLVVFGDHTCAVKYIDFPFIQGADGIKILQPNEKLNPKYLFYWLQSNPVDSSEYRRHFTELKLKMIPVPSLADQERIVAALDEEQAIIDANKRLIDLMNKKIDNVIKRIYKSGEQ
jgi:type I restriction enzyme M protein